MARAKVPQSIMSRKLKINVFTSTEASNPNLNPSCTNANPCPDPNPKYNPKFNPNNVQKR